MERSVEFGYYPRPIDVRVGDIEVATLPNLDQIVAKVATSKGVDGAWIYAPPQESKDFITAEVNEHPYSARVFGLPMTHVLTHQNADSDEHLSFLVWMLGFILGIRLTETEAGFLDATPIEPGTLHDMVLLGPDVHGKAIEHAERFWQAHSANPRVPKVVTAIIHCLFLAQYPQALSFEEFIYLYAALDGCHFLHSLIQGTKPTSVAHDKRVSHLCKNFGMPVPGWADPSVQQNVASSRNETLHEGLFFNEPLGFSTYGGKAPTVEQRHTLLGMQKLVSRLLCALLGLPDESYIRSAVNDPNQHGVRL